MHLKRLAIVNFRNFRELVIDDLSDSLVIVGENNVGKSNLLYALRLLLDPSLPDTARRLRAEDFWDGLDHPFAGNSISISVDITGYDGDAPAEAALADSVIAVNPYVARLTYEFRPKPNIEAEVPGPDEYEYALYGADNPGVRIYEVRRHIQLRVLPALRDAESELQQWRRSPLRPLLERLNIPDNDLAGIAQVLRAASEAVLEQPALGGLQDRIETRMRTIVGDLFSVDPTLGVAASRADQVLRAIRIFVDGLQRRPVSDTSLGVANLLYLTLLLEGIQGAVDHGPEARVFLGVEEPEAHLHPHVQRRLFRHFLLSGTPILLTTHSPNIASVAPLRSLVILRRSEDNGTVAFRAPSGMSNAVIADLERYLDVTRADMVFAKSVILVEGIAEAFVVPALASNRGIDLDAFGISVCAVHGTDFAPYVELLGTDGLNIPHTVVTDGDPDAPQSGLRRALRLIDPDLAPQPDDEMQQWQPLLEQSGIFVGDDTLEVDLLRSDHICVIDGVTDLHNGAPPAGFLEAVAGTLNGDPDERARYLRYVERFGKGRVAQRVVEYMGQARLVYIDRAIDYAVEHAQEE